MLPGARAERPFPQPTPPLSQLTSSLRVTPVPSLPTCRCGCGSAAATAAITGCGPSSTAWAAHRTSHGSRCGLRGRRQLGGQGQRQRTGNADILGFDKGFGSVARCLRMAGLVWTHQGEASQVQHHELALLHRARAPRDPTDQPSLQRIAYRLALGGRRGLSPLPRTCSSPSTRRRGPKSTRLCRCVRAPLPLSLMRLNACGVLLNWDAGVGYWHQVLVRRCRSHPSL